MKTLKRDSEGHKPKFWDADAKAKDVATKQAAQWDKARRFMKIASHRMKFDRDAAKRDAAEADGGEEEAEGEGA